MGSFFKPKTTVTEDPTARMAFETVRPALQFSVDKGIQFGNDVFANPAYSGQRVAGLNPFQTGSADTLGNFATQLTPQAQGATAGLGFSNIGAGFGVGNNAQNIFSQFSGDPTQQIINQAGQYANNPYVTGLIDASARDVSRNLFEQTLPGIDRAATGAGNLNSTRAGVESAVAQRGAADRLADLSSQIRGQFFGTGLGMAQNQYNQNLQNMLQANQGLMQAGQFGVGNLQSAFDLANAGFGAGQMAGGLYQGQSQAELDAAKALFDESLANRANVIGLNSGVAGAGQGFKSVAGVNQGPSTAQQVGAIIGAFT